MSETEQSKAISIRVKHAHRSRYKNQRRHDLRVGHQPGYVDGDRAGLNRVILDLPMPAEITKRAKALRERTNPSRAMRADAAVATIGIITFGHAAKPIFEALTPEEQDAAYLEVAERIADEYGTTLRGLVVHADETAPHAHVVWDCRDHDGVPMSHVMKGSRLQDIAAEVIAQHAPDIVRGVRKSTRIARGDKPSQIYNRSVQQLHQELPFEVAAKEQELEKLNDRVDEMQARVAKLEAKEALNEKEAKRLATYRNRLAVRVKEYSEAKSALDAKTQRAKQQEAALEIKEHVLNTAEDQLDEREITMERRDDELQIREGDITRRESILDRLTDDIGKMVNDIADRLGVGNSLRAIHDRLKSARNELGDDGPSPG
ncbi:plasmid recombination protein [Halocynthiibacter styelae]|uniref:Plasmid recombination protein n=1 Tax=Halocynthiibacter styelae TaxID=2761955 RepID=A0A8J7IC88_9RHOB|nr:plasmid recombination protein [Paenihalocynthiibacter styelae]MBI1492449.1 plasmid recombination protein [Paenihalocynthiibacter styelae]